MNDGKRIFMEIIMKKINFIKLLTGIIVISLVLLILIIFFIDNSRFAIYKKRAEQRDILLNSQEILKKYGDTSKSKIREKLNQAFSSLVLPSDEEAKWLPRKGVEHLKLISEKIKDKQQIKIIENYIRKNKPFLSAIIAVKNFKNIHPVENIIAPNYHGINFLCGSVVDASYVFYVITEDGIIRNSPLRTVDALVEMSNLGDILLYIPFSISNYAFMTNTVFLIDGINRSINGLQLSDSDLLLLLNLLRDRERNIKQMFQVTLEGAVFDFCRLVDSGHYLNVGSLEFWEKIGYDKAIPKSSFSPRMWPLFSGNREKTEMLKEAINIKDDLTNYDNFQMVKPQWLKLEKQHNKTKDATFFEQYINLSQIFCANLRYIAYIRSQKALIASILYKRKHGKFPQKIIDLTPQILTPQELIDPYDGDLLRLEIGNFKTLISAEYDRQSKVIKKYKDCFSLRIYSVGSNGIDQGGRCGNGLILQGDNENDDITSILIIK